MLFADIVVFKPANPKISYFTYIIPENYAADVKVGQLVQVPWGAKSAEGIIIELKKSSNVAKLKDITAILTTIPLLLPHQIKLLKWVSYYYFAPMLNCLEVMLPDSAKELRKMSEAFKDFKTDSIRNTKNHKQTLVLVPTINQIPQILASLVPKPKNPVIYHHELKPKTLHDIWQKIYQGQTDLIIGPRSAIFAPCPKLTKIIIFDEENSSYKDERSPYFHTVNVAIQLSNLTGCNIEISSNAPRVETVHGLLGNWDTRLIAKKKIIRNQITLNFPTNKLPNNRTTYLVDMVNERKLQNFGNISSLLQDQIIKAISAKKKILLFLNRKTEAGNVYCRVCKNSSYQKAEPEICPNCQSPDIVFFSLNLKVIANEVKKIIPAADIGLLSENSQSKYSNSQITIATSVILNTLAPANFSLIGVISADTILALADYLAAERTYQMLTQILRLADKSKAIAIIQTFSPNHFAIKAALDNNYQYFYQNEIKSRIELYYPPFGKLVKLSYSAKNPQSTRETSEKIAEQLNLLVKENNLAVGVLGPNISYMRLSSGVRFNIILKGGKREDFDLLLEAVPPKWQIIIDPKDTL